MVLHKAPIPAKKVMRKGKEEDGLRKEVKQQLKADASGAGDFSADRSTASKMISIANPMNAGSTMMGKVTGSNKYKAHDGAPLYFPSAKSAALRSHSGVKFKVYRIDSPDDISDPIIIVFKLDLSSKRLRTNNPAAVSQKVSRKYYGLRDLDIELWDHDDKWEDGHVWGISLIERHTACMCMGTSGVERDYIFPNKPDRDRFCTLIHAVDDEIFDDEQQALFVTKDASPRAVESDPLKLFVTTWNMGNAPWSTNLGDWIPNNGEMDIVVVGTQESLLKGDSTGLTAGASSKWFKALETHLGPEYVTVATRNMFQNFLTVMTKRKHAQAFSGVETFQAEQGIGKVWGNKGGTAVALRFNGFKLAFVNTHLAAHAEKCEKRIDDIKSIIRDVHFGNYSKVEFVTQYTTFWLGDLNFRVDMDFAEATAALDAGNFAPLIEKEQLTNEMKKGLLDGFIEGELKFRPTYKFDPGETPPAAPRPYSDYKNRTPSWTDRVLCRPQPGHSIKLVDYDACYKVVSSDHDPVYATYDFDASPIPMGGNYRRFLLIIENLAVTDLKKPDANMSITINFPFLDDIKKGVKFKHRIGVRPDPKKPGGFVNENTFKLGPFITTSDFLRRRHVTVRVKDKSERHGTTSVSLIEAVDADSKVKFEAPITKRSYPRGIVTGSMTVRVAGGSETGMSLMEDSTDFEAAKAAGQLGLHEDSESDHEIDAEVLEELGIEEDEEDEPAAEDEEGEALPQSLD